MRHLPGDDQQRKSEPRPRLTAIIRQQFRDTIKAITQRAPAIQPAARRRRTEDTGKLFQMTARAIMGRAARIPTAAHRAAAYLWDTLDWLNPWHDPGSLNQNDEELHQEQQDHLSLHL